jgi:hypothetical protein
MLAPAPAKYRIEVMSGPLNGHRFDVVSGGLETLTLVADTSVFTGAPFGSLLTNTANLQAQLTGAQIMLVKYLTLGEMLPISLMTATNDPDTADRVLYSDGVSGWVVYWADLNDGSPRWSAMGDLLTDRGSDIIAAHQAVYIDSRSTAKQISSYGMVRQSNFAQPISNSAPMLGVPYPMTMTPLQMGYQPATFTGSRNPELSDQVLNWTNDSDMFENRDGYSAHWLNRTAARQQWIKLGDSSLTNQNNNGFIRAGRGYWYDTRSARPLHVVPQPWTLPVRFTDDSP